MSDSNLPVITVRGRQFIEAKPEEEATCVGCVANEPGAGSLCGALPECSGRTFNIIFKEIS